MVFGILAGAAGIGLLVGIVLRLIPGVKKVVPKFVISIISGLFFLAIALFATTGSEPLSETLINLPLLSILWPFVIGFGLGNLIMDLFN